jgi:HEAT repeat protein
LGKLGDSSAIRPLFDALGDREYVVREAAAIALSKLRDTVSGRIFRKMKLRSRLIHNGVTRIRARKRFAGYVAPLLLELWTGDDADRMASALALGLIGGERPVQPLAQVLSTDRTEDVRVAAVTSLGLIGRAGAKRALRQALNDEPSGIRRKVAEALALLRDKTAVQPLLVALRDDDKRVRLTAAENLGYLGGGNHAAELMIRNALSGVEHYYSEDTIRVLRKMDEEKEHRALYAAFRNSQGLRDSK